MRAHFPVLPLLVLLGVTAPPAAAQQATADTARLALRLGGVAIRGVDSTRWSPAAPGASITSGASVWTEPRSRAALEIDAGAVWLNSATELDVDQVDPHTVAVTIPRGELYLRLRDPRPGESFSVRTPRGMVDITQGGRYAIAAGDADHLTTIEVLEGAARVSGEGVDLQVRAGQSADITGTPHGEQGAVQPLVVDPFVRHVLLQERGSSVASVTPGAPLEGPQSLGPAASVPMPGLPFPGASAPAGQGHAGPPLMPMGPPPLPSVPVPAPYAPPFSR